MTAIDSLLAGMIDYAGLYPPASLDLQNAARNYLEYSRGAHARVLDRFIVDLDSFPQFCNAAGDSVRNIRLSLIVSPHADWDELHRLVEKGFAIGAVEVNGASAAEIGRIAMRIPPGIDAFFEVPIDAPPVALDAIASAGARAHIRTGGLTAEAIPSAQALAQVLSELAARRLIFKATSALRHPLRGRHALTCQAGGPTAVTHGFINLACAAALLYFGGDARDTQLVLEEEWPGAWHVTPEAITWEENGWSGDELREVRQQFFAGFASSSFEEPIRELEALRWL